MRLVWITGLAALVLFAGMAWYLRALEPGVLALQLAYTPKSFGAIVHVWSADQLARYRNHIPVDYALLLAYGAFGWLLASRAAAFRSLPAPARHAARWSLPLAALFDATENAFHWWLTAMPRFGNPEIYLFTTACSLLKWALLVGFGYLTVYAVLRHLSGREWEEKA
jgi:hypothetical protein